MTEILRIDSHCAAIYFSKKFSISRCNGLFCNNALKPSTIVFDTSCGKKPSLFPLNFSNTEQSYYETLQRI